MERIQEELRDGVVPPPHPGLITVGSCHGPGSQRVGEPCRNFRDELWALSGRSCGLWSKDLVSSLHPSGGADGNSPLSDLPEPVKSNKTRGKVLSCTWSMQVRTSLESTLTSLCLTSHI